MTGALAYFALGLFFLLGAAFMDLRSDAEAVADRKRALCDRWQGDDEAYFIRTSAPQYLDWQFGPALPI